MPEYLLVFDLDKIHEYVFATGRLKEIRGGSALMWELTEERAVLDLLKAYDPKTVYIGGGAGKVVIKAKDETKARQAVALLEKQVREQTVSGSLTAVVSPINGDFKAAVEQGDWLLRKRKADKRLCWQLSMAPVTEFCQSCRAIPAVHTMDGRDLCVSCSTKRAKADTWKNTFWSKHPVAEKFIEVIEKRHAQYLDDWQKPDIMPSDLNELASFGLPGNYIGFIYCDGNRLGQHLSGLDGTQSSYAEFSTLVNSAVLESAAVALAEAYPRPRQRKMPFDIVLAGGDDLMVITTADGAIDVAVTFCREFQNRTRQGRHEVSMSAGVVLVHAHQPIVQVQRRAKELLTSAKHFSNEVWQRTRTELSAIDFLVSSSSTLDSLSVLRSVEYGFKDTVKGIADIQHWCHRRPYAVEEMQQLAQWIRQLKRGIPAQDVPPIPYNKLKEIYHDFFQSQRQMQIEYDLIVSTLHLRDEHRNWLLKEIPAALLGTAQGSIWQERQDRRTNKPEFCAVLPDLVELYDFVKA